MVSHFKSENRRHQNKFSFIKHCRIQICSCCMLVILQLVWKNTNFKTIYMLNKSRHILKSTLYLTQTKPWVLPHISSSALMIQYQTEIINTMGYLVGCTQSVTMSLDRKFIFSHNSWKPIFLLGITQSPVFPRFCMECLRFIQSVISSSSWTLSHTLSTDFHSYLVV